MVQHFDGTCCKYSVTIVCRVTYYRVYIPSITSNYRVHIPIIQWFTIYTALQRSCLHLSFVTCVSISRAGIPRLWWRLGAGQLVNTCVACNSSPLAPTMNDRCSGKQGDHLNLPKTECRVKSIQNMLLDKVMPIHMLGGRINQSQRHRYGSCWHVTHLKFLPLWQHMNLND